MLRVRLQPYFGSEIIKNLWLHRQLILDSLMTLYQLNIFNVNLQWSHWKNSKRIGRSRLSHLVWSHVQGLRKANEFLRKLESVSRPMFRPCSGRIRHITYYLRKLAKFQVLTAVLLKVQFFWQVKLYRCGSNTRGYEGSWRMHLHGIIRLREPEDENNTIFRNVWLYSCFIPQNLYFEGSCLVSSPETTWARDSCVTQWTVL